MVAGVRSSYMTLSRAGDNAIRRKTETPPKQWRVSPRRAFITKTCQRFSQIIPRSLQRRTLFFVEHMTERRFVAPKPIDSPEELFRRLREGTAATLVQSGLSKKRVGMRCGMRVLLARRVGLPGRRHHSIRDTFQCTIEWTDHAAPIDSYVQTPHQSARRQLVPPVRKEYAEQSLSRLCTSSGRWTVRRSADRTRRRYSKLLMIF